MASSDSRDSGGESSRHETNATDHNNNSLPLIQFQENSSIIVTGSSKSGKTYWINKFLQQLDQMFAGTAPSEVLYYFLHDQPLYAEMRENLKDRITFREGVPSLNDIMEFAKDDQHRLIIFFDVMHLIVDNKDISLLFTNLVHHKKMSCMIVYQNLFSAGKYARTISVNADYLVVFKNVRDKSQIAYLGRQLYPGKQAKMFMAAYMDAVKSPHSYLVIDMTVTTNDMYRLRSHIFPGEQMIIYQI